MMEQERKEETHTHQEQPQRATVGAKKKKRFEELVFHSQNICEFASESEELTAILHRAYDNVMVEMEELKGKRKGTCSLSHEDANLESVNELQSLPRVRTIGHSKNRLSSSWANRLQMPQRRRKRKL
ncbi:hypothetical protein Ahy_B05g075972 [Arachis hypogaea]|uniref:Uncharacterized protein n=1 Tax=Arachis hypogaea TaxID=3818 RepID=A0A444Z2B7_ARAHY|nr:hypothetical protein Ahy_B05g075972 [Arachis hypogaea]